jgi:nuclear transport factor 2 (NTF2) superfamily protein
MAYTPDSLWRNRSEFLSARGAIVQFLGRKWTKEQADWLIKNYGRSTATGLPCALPASHDDLGNWFRSYDNENWEFEEYGFMQRRLASINDLPIPESERKYHWSLGRPADDHPGLTNPE